MSREFLDILVEYTAWLQTRDLLCLTCPEDLVKVFLEERNRGVGKPRNHPPGEAVGYSHQG